jgi:hypothetical protein
VKPIDALRAHWDRALALGLTVVGVVMLVVGYYRISHTPYPAEQLPLLMSAGVGSLFLLGLGATLWLSADLRDEWHKLDELTGSSDDVTPVAEPRLEGTDAPALRSDDRARVSAR